MSIVGYARTSTHEQVAGLDDQVRELVTAGCDPNRIWREHASSVSVRVELDAALAWVRDGDTFIVTKPDRLARSAGDMYNIVRSLRTRNVEVRILSMGFDTSSTTGKFMLTMLAAVAEFERDIMLDRQKAGIAKARIDGKYKGRKRKVDRIQALIWKAEGVSIAEIGRRMNADPSNVRRALNPPPTTR